MKLLIVGDPHVQVHNLNESQKLIDSIYSFCQEQKVGGVVILGDLFHTHGLIRLEILNFWNKALSYLNTLGIKIFILTGNHDICGHEQKDALLSSLSVFNNKFENIIVISEPEMHNGMGMMPYTGAAEDFKKGSDDLLKRGAKLLFCHQTFNGAAFENGFYAPNGIPTEYVKDYAMVISGHIHKAQSFANIWYPGSPRWLTMSDANEDKYFYLFCTETLAKESFSTENICNKIYKFSINEKNYDIIKNNMPQKGNITVEITGTKEFINYVKKNLGANIKIISNPVHTNKNFIMPRNALINILEYAEHQYNNLESPKELFLAELKNYIT